MPVKKTRIQEANRMCLSKSQTETNYATPTDRPPEPPTVTALLQYKITRVRVSRYVAVWCIYYPQCVARTSRTLTCLPSELSLCN